MEPITFNETFVNSFHDVLDNVLRVVLKPNLTIGLGSGKIIDLFVEWLITNAQTAECSGLSVLCTEKQQVVWLKNRGINARHGVPENSGDWMHQLDYFFEMPDCMNRKFEFVKLSPYCEVRKHLYKKAKQSIFFYHYKQEKRFPPFTVIPIEIAPAYEASLSRYFTTRATSVQPSFLCEQEGNLMRINWMLTTKMHAKSCESKGLSAYTKCLKGVHGVISHGFFNDVHGHVIEICEKSIDEMYMTATSLF